MSRHGAGQSRREIKKADKVDRIRAAALHLFSTRGYDDTTTREIAARAGVGMGTVFVYAETKRDLLFLVVNDDLEACIEAAGQVPAMGLSLHDTLIAVLRIHYEYFRRVPNISRAALREMYFYESGRQAGRFVRTRQALGSLLEEVISAAAGRGLIRTAEAPDGVAAVIFAIFQVHLRRWLAEDAPVVDEAMETLGRQIRIVMHGLSPQPQAFSAEPRPAAKDGVDAEPGRRAS